MRILLDHDVPHSLRPQFSGGHEVVTAQYQGWTNYDDDQLLAAAEEEFSVLVTLTPISRISRTCGPENSGSW